MTAPSDSGISLQELRLAARNHALPLEALRSPITPIGLHYLLMVPPGIPDFATRERILDPGPVLPEGRAWCGRAPIVRSR